MNCIPINLDEYRDKFEAVYLTAAGDPNTVLNVFHEEWAVHAVMLDGRNFYVNVKGPLDTLGSLLGAMLKTAAEADQKSLRDGETTSVDFVEFTT